MAADALKYVSGNSASTTLSSGVTNIATSAPLTADSAFNAKSGEGMVIIDEGTANEEFAYATTKTGGALTIPLVNRGLEGGSAQSHSSGASVKGVLTAGMWNNLIDALALIIDKAAGTIKSGITFASAILTTPTITTPTIGTSIIVNDVYSLGNLTGAVTIDPANGDRQGGTLTGNVTGITLTAPASNKKRTLTLYLGTGTGTFTIAWTTSVTWQDGATWGTGYYTTTASKLNVIVLYYDGSAWWGMPGKFA